MLACSVVIATYQRGEEVLRLAESVLRQECLHSFELVIVDQTESHDPYVEGELKRLAQEPAVTFLRAAPPSLPGARNLGIAAAQGDVVVFIDDDVRLRPGFIDAHVAAYTADPSLSGVAGRVHSFDGRPSQELFHITRFGRNRGEFDRPESGPASTARGCNMSFRKDWLTKVDGFDTRFRGNAYREESDLCFRIREAGGHLRFCPEAILDHMEADSGGCREAGPIHDRPLAYGNEVLFFLKHWPRAWLPVLLVVNYFSYVFTRYTLKTGRVVRRTRAWVTGVRAGIDAFGHEAEPSVVLTRWPP